MSELIEKVRLITKDGLVLAEIPESKDVTQSQLTGGMMSALLSFSEKAISQNLKSINFHDSTINLAKINGFIITVEFISNITNEQMKRIMKKITERATTLLSDYDPQSIGSDMAIKMLNEIIDSDWFTQTMEDLGFQQPLKDSKSFYLEIKHMEDDFKILQSPADNPVVMPLCGIIHERMIQNQEKIDHLAFIPFLDLNVSIYAIISYREPVSKVAFLQVNEELTDTLFKLNPILQRKINTIPHDQNNLQSVVSDLQFIYDPGQVEESFFREKDISPKILDRFLDSGIDQVLYNIITSRDVIVVGDQHSVKVIVNALLMFTPHISVNVVEWLDESEEEVGHNITGMSESTFDKLKSTLTEDTVIVHLNDGEVKNGVKNKYLRKFFNKVKQEEIGYALDKIKEEISNIKSCAYQLTSLILLEKNDAIQSYKDLMQEVDNSNKFDIIKDMAIQRNPWIKSFIQTLVSSFWML